MKKLLFFLGILVLINLQYSLIFTNNNILDYLYLKNQNNTLINNIKNLESKNQDLTQEINELASSSHALENFARYNLGLVKRDETYIHIINK
tara:strand:+ start:225 stop:500 length:276 start_codon:yes stop_codon:yes gene_type:complete